MNKLCLILALIFLNTFLIAQPTEGRFLIGGSLIYNNPTTENADAEGNPNGLRSSTKNLTGNLQAGYFITPNFVLGLTTSYVNNYSILENIPSSKTISNSISWYYGLFGRTYTAITEKLYFTNSFSISIRKGDNEVSNFLYHPDSTSATSLNVRGYNLNYSPGFSYFLKPWLTISIATGAISYEHSITTITSGPGTNTAATNGLFSTNIPLSNFNIGFQIFILKGKEGK